MADNNINNFTQGNININLSKNIQKQREVFAKIDAATSLLEKMPYFADDGVNVPFGNSIFYTYGNKFGLSTNPLGFLFSIIQSLGVDEGKLKSWIVELLVRVLPEVEVGIKATLLANIKSIVSCSSDPRIPINLRKNVTIGSVLGNNEIANTVRGLKIPVDTIDPDGILNLSPFTEPGMLKYFGCISDERYDKAIREKTEVPYYGDDISAMAYGDFYAKKAKLARAEDFNAFLWFIIHNGNRKLPTRIKINDRKFKFKRKQHDIIKGETLLGELVTKKHVDENDNGVQTNIIPGDTFFNYENPNCIGMCLKNEYGSDMETPTGNTIVPVSSDWYSCNWYVDKSNYYGANLGYRKNAKRDYSKEKAICNLRYFKRTDAFGYEDVDLPDYFKFTILPKPYVILPSISLCSTTSTTRNTSEHQVNENGQSVTVTSITQTEGVEICTNWKPIKLLFDAEGNADQNGKYSLISEYDPQHPTLTKSNSTTEDIAVYNIYNSGETTLSVNRKTGEYWLSTTEHIEKFLIECYPGLTVYEFNYDYIMGMKLLDPKVVCQKMFENSLNPRFNGNFEMSFNKTKNNANYPYFSGKQRLLGIITNILNENDDDEINDCFYAFSNEQFEEMLKKTEEIKYKEQPFNQGYNEGVSFNLEDVYKTLSEYPETGTLKDQIDVINKAIEQACGIFDEKINATTISDSSTLKVDFLTDMLQKLVMSVVDSILSPKVLMLLMVNEKLMGDEGELTSINDLMSAMKGLVKGLIKEIRDLIMQKLLDYIISYLTPMAVQMKIEIGKEQFSNYIDLIKLLTIWFNAGKYTANNLSGILKILFNRLKKNKKYNTETEIDLPTVLDEITYADIFDTDGTVDTPIINNC